ncbi:RNA methyltransferase [Haladaptatus sp. R4]|uniref:RNA methyltransferase n=1 Tax=Haladaptatus sp. R4 TaxID=1679489 RepID=UPI0007B4C371|nr:RNA methyltransferase [Haladaptatus sp. R4]KZN23785.1 RNA methyltransferase [Haladaptatus sp. R4]
MKPAVAIVEPKTPGNIGTIARAMKNFGLDDLKLVNPPEFGRDSEAYGFAGQAREDVLPNYDDVTFDELVENYHTVGLTATTNEDASHHVRFPFTTPRELAENLETVETDTVLIFGREANGLTNEELARIDEVCSIPASAAYPALNLGQAATVTLYELRTLTVDEYQLPDVERERADEGEIEGFYGAFSDLLDTVGQPAEKHDKNMRMIRRLFGRAHPTGREIATLRGIVRRANERASSSDSHRPRRNDT